MKFYSTIKEHDSWRPVIEPASTTHLILTLAVMLFSIGVLFGYTFTELNYFNSAVSQVFGP